MCNRPIDQCRFGIVHPLQIVRLARGMLLIAAFLGVMTIHAFAAQSDLIV